MGSRVQGAGNAIVWLLFLPPLQVGTLLRCCFAMAPQADAKGKNIEEKADSAIAESPPCTPSPFEELPGADAELRTNIPKAWAELKADKNSASEPCEVYVNELVQSVQERLRILLTGTSAIGGIDLKGTLQQQEPLRIDGTGTLQTTKEHWRWENCRSCLETKGLYEAPGSLFWFSKLPPRWEGEVLPASSLTYAMMAAGRLVWSDEKFMRSSDDPAKRRYSIRFAIHHQPIRG